MMRSSFRLVSDRSAAAAAEMALALPLLVTLLFGSFELGYYFLSEHVVQKAVRDAARYASRLPMTSYPSCDPVTGISSAARLEIQKLARTGTPQGTTARLQGWTQDTMTTVTMSCDTSGTYSGVYATQPNVPIVTVSAAVPYPSLFGTVGLPDPGLTLNARSQSAVFGA